MQLDEFEAELKLINKDLSIRPNNPPKRVVEAFPDVMKLATITYMGVEVCTIPANEIFDEKNGSYGVDIRQDGRFVAHRTRPEALAIINSKLEQLKNDKTEADAFFGRGDYSDAALRAKEPSHTEIMEEVTIEPKEILGGTLEGPQ